MGIAFLDILHVLEVTPVEKRDAIDENCQLSLEVNYFYYVYPSQLGLPTAPRLRK